MLSFKSYITEVEDKEKHAHHRAKDLSKRVSAQVPYGNIKSEEILDEMDKSQTPPGRDDPYDYSKGKWSKGKPLSKDKTNKVVSDILSKSFNHPKKKTVKEDGGGGGGGGAGGGAGAVGSVGPSNTDAGVAATGDSRLPASQREPGVSRKKKGHNPIMMGFRRKPPKI
jgi:hypothetical protein